MSGPKIEIPVAATIPDTNKVLPIAENQILVTVDYQKGKVNWFNGQSEPGGIYAYYNTAEAKDGSVRMVLGKGLKILLEPATRLNRKKVAAAFEKVKAEIEGKTGQGYEVLLKTAEKYSLKIV